MPREDRTAFESLVQAERIIQALEIIVQESEGKGLDPFIAHLKVCIDKCQADYLARQRKIYRDSTRKPPKPPGTEH